MTALPDIGRPSRWHRVVTWKRHRKLHGILMDLLQHNGGTGDTITCVHCGRGWRLRGNHYTGATWLEGMRSAR